MFWTREGKRVWRLSTALALSSAAAAGLGLLALLAAEAGARAPDLKKVVGPNECAECHKQETQAWKASHHRKTFSRLPRNKDATKIAKAMGFKRIKSGSECLTCHFTSQPKGNKEKPIAGITCESCHGAAKDWVKRHSEYSGKKKETESAAEAKQRWAEAEAAGMIRPGRVYALTKNCYSCHVVPEEKLVDKGGHPAGSPFELVAWSQGEVRHNTWHNDGKENREADAKRKRMLYAVGAAVELETALRAVSNATKAGRFAVTMAHRAEIARLRMRRLARASGVPALVEIADLAGGVSLSLGNGPALKAAADKVAELAQRFAETNDGSKLAAIDPYLPKNTAYKGDTVLPKGP